MFHVLLTACAYQINAYKFETVFSHFNSQFYFAKLMSLMHLEIGLLLRILDVSSSILCLEGGNNEKIFLVILIPLGKC
jgi:hypothetical protein